ncbi:MAG: hypothetical protein KF764_14075 [Labilithrix sp.]|nr:hypothetical protein [Labilithrix sp.]MBX3221368.1 hypothetical protein [Labilithrix sp.]
MKRAWLVAAWLVGCSSRGEFRPAKNAATFPPTSDAFRVHQVPAECRMLGSVDGESLEDIVEITTKHGGTHYIVRVDRTELQGYSGIVVGGTVNMTPDTSRFMSATAYRCP